MIDIKFYMKVYPLKREIIGNKICDQEFYQTELEKYRSLDPVIYNIETTNACNMKCEMCPRTSMMTRPIETMDLIVFKKIIDQIRPFSESEWETWQTFVEKEYRISRHDMSENHFFLHVIPKVLVLHGYGDPLLDKDMPEKVRLLSERGIPSYFSCNPANIDIDKTIEMFENGLSYIKYSVESTDDQRHKEVRGSCSNFNESYNNILRILELKKKCGYKTVVVITMLNLNKSWQIEEYEKLCECFKGHDVYIYLKSQDQQWYQEQKHETKSIHWTEFCQFPWSSMTIKSNGEAVMCVEDFNNEIILGDAITETLYDIWNGELYRRLRQDHFELTSGIKCTGQCDMKLIGQVV